MTRTMSSFWVLASAIGGVSLVTAGGCGGSPFLSVDNQPDGSTGSSSSSGSGGSSSGLGSSSSGGHSSSSGGGSSGSASSSGGKGSSSSGGASSSSGGSSGSSGSSSGSGGSSSSSGSSSGRGGSSSGSDGGVLKWYWTCGGPVCAAPVTDAGSLTDDAGAPCPPIGSSCSVQGQRCGLSTLSVNCGAVEVCASQDPTKPPNACPISSRKYKDGIEYVDGAGMQELHDETLQMRLATYNYKANVDDPTPRHLGFIIEDNPPQSRAVDWSHDRVDLYGYLSMVVATIQVQEKEIGELRRELAVARARAGASFETPSSR